ncbi:MAG: DUF4433 domain-containing protein [Chloroflexi bacterium]|nr:DUF4433 domain-containing protein [Chloroflexota bacterium]
MKPDAARIVARLQALKAEPWLGPARAWWPDYLFHVTDVQNAARILTSGRLLSRARCDETGAMMVDNASEQILAGTDPAWQAFVRLYFRPKTPFQYQTEGFRPIGQRGGLQAYCPMPVVFLFDAVSVLTRAGTPFSARNLAAANAQVGDDATFFEMLPFEEIYHSSPLSEAEKRSIVHRRHAEVVVPGELDLSALRRVWCRSPAEQQTLQTLVPQRIWMRFAARVGSSPRPNLFNRLWTFVERAELSADRIDVRLNPWSRTPGPFAARVDVLDARSRHRGSWSEPEFDSRPPNQELVIDLGASRRLRRYWVGFWLDDRLAYAGSYSGEAEDLF